jgi:hypothetical protein
VLNPLKKKRRQTLITSDKRQVMQMLEMTTMPELKEYNTVLWDHIKYHSGHNIKIDGGAESRFATILGIWSYEIQAQVLEVLVKVQWLEEKNSRRLQPENAVYNLSKNTEFVSPTCIMGHVLVMDDPITPADKFIRDDLLLNIYRHYDATE